MKREEFKAYLDKQSDHRQFGRGTCNCPLGAWLNESGKRVDVIHVAAFYTWKNYQSHDRIPNPDWAIQFVSHHDALGQPVTATLARKLLEEVDA